MREFLCGASRKVMPCPTVPANGRTSRILRVSPNSSGELSQAELVEPQPETKDQRSSGTVSRYAWHNAACHFVH